MGKADASNNFSVTRRKKKRRKLADNVEEQQVLSIMDIAAFDEHVKERSGWVVLKWIEKYPIFHFLKHIEADAVRAPRHWVWLNMGIECAQLMAFTLNPHYRWGTAAKGVSYAFYFFQMPLWDSAQFGIGFIGSAVVLYAMFCCLLLVTLAGLHRMFTCPDIPPWMNGYRRAFSWSTGVLFIAALQHAMSLMVCHRGELWAYPGESCTNATSVANFAFGFFTIAILMLLVWVSRTFLYMGTPSAKVWLSRSHAEVDAVSVGVYLTTCVLYHHFISRGSHRWLCLYAALVFFFLGVLWAVKFPYFKPETVQIRVTSCWLASWCAILAGILETEKGREVLAQGGSDLAVLLVGCVGVYLLARRLHKWRISPLFERDLALLRDHGKLRSNASRFPSGLDVADKSFNKYVAFLDALLPQDEMEEASSVWMENRVPTNQHSFTTPYTDSVWFSTDCELACRFIHRYERIANSEPTNRMLMFAMRIFVKGMVRFRESPALCLHVAQYLYHCLQCDMAAIRWLAMLDHMDVPLGIRYQGWKLMQVLKVDTRHMEGYARAKQGHAFCLQRVADFWRMLQEENVNKAALDACAKDMAQRSQTVLLDYFNALRLENERALRKADIPMAVDYGLFLEQVLMAPELGDRSFSVCGEFVATHLQNKMQGARRGAKGQELSASVLPDLGEVRVASGMAGESKQQMGKITGANQIVQAKHVLNGVFVFLVFLLTIFLVLSVVSVGRRQHIVDAVHAAGRVRALNSQAAFLVEELASSNAAHPPPAPLLDPDAPEGLPLLRGAPTKLTYKHQKLLGVASDMHAAFNNVAWGSSSSDFGGILDHLTKLYVQFEEYPNQTYDTGWEPDPSRESLWSAVYKSLQTYFSFGNVPLAEMRWDAHRSFVVGNSAGTLADGLNRSMLLYQDWNAEDVDLMSSIIIVILVCSVVLVLFVFALLVTRFRGIDRTKRNVRDVVTFVPPATMRKLERNATEQLREFDTYKDHPEKFLRHRRYVTEPNAPGGGGLAMPTFNVGEGNRVRDDASPVEDHEQGEAEGAGQARRASRDLVSADHRGSRFSVVVRVALLLLVLLAAGQLTVPLVARGVYERFDDKFHRSTRGFEAVNSARADVQLMDLRSRDFVLSGRDADYDAYWRAYHAALGDPERRRTVLDTTAPCCSPDFIALYDRAIHRTNAVAEERQKTAMALRISATQDMSAEGGTRWEVANHSWRRPAEVSLARRGYPIEEFVTNESTDMQLPAAEKLELARRLVCSKGSLARWDEVGADFTSFVTSLNKDTAGSLADSVDMLAALIDLTLALGVALPALCAVVLVRRSSEPVLQGGLLIFSALLILGTSAATIAVSRVNRGKYVNDLRELAEEANECKSLLFAIEASQRDLTDETFAFVVTGDLSAHLDYRKDVLDFEKRWDELQLVAEDVMDCTGEECASSASTVLVFGKLAEARKNLADAMVFETVAFGMAARHFNLSLPELHAVTWDETLVEHVPWYLKPTFARDAHITNSSYDTATLGPAGKLRDLALHQLESDWYRARVSEFHKNLGLAANPFCKHREARLQDALDESQTLNMVQVYITVVLLFALALLFASVLRQFVLAEQSRSSDSTQGGSASRSQESEKTLHRQIRKVTWALGLVVALIAVIFTLVYIDLDSSKGQIVKLHYASGRTWQVAQSMLTADRLVHDVTYSAEGQRRLRDSVAVLSDFEDRLFFGEAKSGGSSYSSVGESAAQDLLLFGPDAAVPEHYRDCNATLDTVTSAMIGRGVSHAYREWLGLVAALGSMDLADTRNVAYIVKRMRELVTPLLDGLFESSSKYATAEKDRLQASTVAIMGVVFGAMLIMLLAFFVNFRPLLMQLQDEETTTRYILRMIPQEVRELPEVLALLEDNAETEESNTHISDAVAEMSPWPLVAIDHNGIILKTASIPLKQYFGYASNEVAGVNVKILQPDRYAQNHDQYLANYRRTGQKRVIDRLRQVEGRRKDGSEFPVEILVRQFFCSGGDSVFIGSLRDLSEDLALAAAQRTNRTILDTATIPVIIMDDHGTIIKANSACCSTLEFSDQEMVGENIKMLMTPQVAQHHDKYLANYRETRVRHVIGQNVRQRAQKKNGETFSVELTVQEVEGHDGLGSTFVGFIRDVAADEYLEQQQALNDTLSDMSPVPVVVIDIFGKVIKVSQAAEKVWGYARSRVEGRNVKMLMPEKYAVEHDGYLQRYRETRIRHVVGTTREVEAMRQNGSVFPIKLTIQEIDKASMGLTFVAYCEDLSVLKQQEREQQLSALVSFKSSIPIILINIKGTVQEFSTQAERDFGWKADEVVGQNIKMLMPPSVAMKHDSFLATYAATGVKKVIDTTRLVTAMRKDKTEFPVEIRVSEIHSEHGDNTYVGYVRNLQEQRRLQQTFSVNEAVNHISPVPIIAINHVGIVWRFSRAAEETWGHPARDIIGNNIKKLMPPAVAVNHDGYLQRYARTQVKRVVDTTRNVTAMRRNGEEFPVEISVREVRKDGNASTFVGYARDTTQDDHGKRAAALGEQIFRHVIVPLIVMSEMGIIQNVNPKTCENFGWTEKELVGRNVKILQPKEIADKHDSYLANYRRTGVKRVINTTRRVAGQRKDKTQFPADITVREIFSSASKQMGVRTAQFVAFVEDMSEAEGLEEAMQAVDVVVNLSTIPVVSIDYRGSIIKFSVAAEEAFGYKQSELLGKNVKMLMPEHIAEKHDGYLSNYRRTGKKTIIDALRVLNARRCDGSLFNVEACVKEVLQADGQSVYVGYLRDAAFDNAILREEELMKRIRDLSTAPIIAMDTQGTILSWNRAAIELFGYAEDEVVGEFNSITKIQPHNIAENHQSYLDKYLKTGIKTVVDTVREVPALTKDKVPLLIEISVKEMLRQDGSRTFLGYVRDLAERQQTERAVRLNTAMLGLAMNPLICIDDYGKIFKFSESASKCFQIPIDEAIGGNVKMLMPDFIAVKHDGFLQRYRETGVRTVVGTTRAVRGRRRRDGVEFPVSITVREVKKETGESLFVGYAVDATDTEDLALQMRVSETVGQFASVPLIQIDPLGTVQKFNIAAAEAFKFDASAVLGNNIKMLMPQEFAKDHDYYLKRYMTDGVKRVVDTQRQVIAQRSDGSCFPIEISVKEISLRQGQQKHRVFMGYARDITMAHVLSQATRVNDAITAIAPVPVIAINGIGQVFKFSAAAERLFGYSVDEVLSKNVSLLMPDDIRVKHDGYLKRYKQTGRKKVVGQTTTGFKGKHKSGKLFPVEIKVVEISKEGQETLFVGCVRDYTEDIIRADEMSLTNAIQNASPIPIIAITPTGVILRFSPSCERVFGWSTGEMIGKQVELLMPDEVAQPHPGYLKRYLRDGVKRVVDTTRKVPAKTKQGKVFEIEIQVKEIKTGQDHLFIAYLHDLTFEHEANMIAKVGMHINDMLESSLIVIDQKGIILMFNKAASEVFQFLPEEVVGKNVKILMPEEAAIAHDGYLSRYLRTGRKTIIDGTREVTAESKEGQAFQVSISVREVLDDSGLNTYVGYLQKVQDKA